MTSDQWAYVVGVALPEYRIKQVMQQLDPPLLFPYIDEPTVWHITPADFKSYDMSNSDLIRLALSRATYDERTQIMAMVLGAKDE